MNDLITRLVVAFETIGAALTTIASGQQNLPLTPGTDKPAPAAAATAADKPKATGTKGKTTQAADPKPDAAADPSKAAAEAQAAAEAKAKAEQAAKEKDAEPKFDYELLKKAIIELAGMGIPGKEAAINILTDVGLERGQKASEADPKHWPAMYEKSTSEIARIKAAETAEQFG